MTDVTEAAINRAADHADRACEPISWKRLAYVRALEFLVRKGPGTTFITSEMAAWCEAHHLPAPPDARAYGRITRDLSAKGRIVDTLERPRAGSHGREVVRWRVV